VTDEGTSSAGERTPCTHSGRRRLHTDRERAHLAHPDRRALHRRPEDLGADGDLDREPHPVAHRDAHGLADDECGEHAERRLRAAIRIAHNPGFDRLVFEFSPTDRGVGAYGIPPYLIEVASSFSGPSGQPVTVAGNAYFRVRFQNTDAHTNAGQVTLTSSDLKPNTPLIKEVRIVEDFEATVQAAVGLDHLACPSVLTLGGPARVVLDFPTPP
jgi:hypothetical protein